MACSTLNFLILSDSSMKIASFVTSQMHLLAQFASILACIFCRKTVKMCHVGGLDAGRDKCHKTAVMPPSRMPRLSDQISGNWLSGRGFSPLPASIVKPGRR